MFDVFHALLRQRQWRQSRPSFFLMGSRQIGIIVGQFIRKNLLDGVLAGALTTPGLELVTTRMPRQGRAFELGSLADTCVCAYIPVSQRRCNPGGARKRLCGGRMGDDPPTRKPSIQAFKYQAQSHECWHLTNTLALLLATRVWHYRLR